MDSQEQRNLPKKIDLSTFSTFERILFFIAFRGTAFLISDYYKKQREFESKKERELIRNFKIEVQTGFFSNKVKYIQRDKPLTDEELDLIYNNKV